MVVLPEMEALTAGPTVTVTLVVPEQVPLETVAVYPVFAVGETTIEEVVSLVLQE